MNEYRCTRITPHGEPYATSAPARHDKTARVGYFLRVRDEVEAYNYMAKQFPEDLVGKSPKETFTVDLHKENVS